MEPLERFLTEHHEFSSGRKTNYRTAFKAFARHVPDPFHMTREQFIEAYTKLEKEHLPNTWNGYVSSIRAFYKQVYGDGEEYPEAVRKVRMKRVDRTGYVRTKILSEDEINALIRVADHPRDRALIAFYAGTGARLSEALSIHMRDIHVFATEKGPILEFVVSGKTGTHLTPLVAGGYAKLLLNWLDHHPQRDNPDAPLWCSLRNYDGQVKLIKKSNVHKTIKKLLKASGLKRNVHCHMFRHTQSRTDAMRKIPMATRKSRHGWSPESNTPAIYEHLTDEDGAKAYLESLGIAKEKRTDNLGVVKCVVCGEVNAESSKFCGRCGVELGNIDAVEKLKQQKLLEKLLNSKAFMDNFLKVQRDSEKTDSL